MENELLTYLRDLGAKVISLFGISQKQSKEQHEALRATIADEAITTRKLIKALDEAEEKPEKPEKIDFKPLIKSQEAEANFTRKTIEAGTKEIEKLTKVTQSSSKEVAEASKSIKNALESFKVTIPPQKEITFPKIDFKVITEPLSKLFVLVKEGFNSMLARGTKEDPIYVKHLDPNGNPVDPSKVIAYGGAPSSSGSGTDMTATNALLTDIKTNTEDLEMLKKTVSVSSTGTILTPASGKKIRIFALKFSLTADLTNVSFNFDGDADFEKYLLPKAGGLYGHSISPNFFTGDTDQVLEIGITGTADVQVNIDYQEVN